MNDLTLIRNLLQESNDKQGTYAGVRFSDDTIERIKAFIKKYDIPNAVRSSKLHTTLLYSRKHLPNFEARGKLDSPIIGTPTGFDLWKTQPKEGQEQTQCLVLKYDAPELKALHEALMKEHGATWDYPDFNAHVTLSYNYPGSLEDVGDPSEVGEIEIVEEYGEDLNLDWANSSSK